MFLSALSRAALRKDIASTTPPSPVPQFTLGRKKEINIKPMISFLGIFSTSSLRFGFPNYFISYHN
jgi:hypothetical protein